MKALFVFLLIAAVVVLFFDDKSKRAGLADAEARASAAQQASDTQSQEIRQLNAQVVQLEGQLSSRSGNTPSTPSGQPSTPAWYQQHLNGTPTLLDPNGGPP